MTTRVQLQPAWVLHSKPYRDTSLLLEVLTAEHGRLSLIAKGARRQRRGGSQGAILQPFLPLLLSFSGRSDLKTLVACEAAGIALKLRSERLFSALYLNELLLRLLHRYDPYPVLFAEYAATLTALTSPQLPDPVLRRFELNLLQELGYGFALDTEGVRGECLQQEVNYRYDSELGLVAGSAAHPGDLPGAHLLQIAQDQFGDEVRMTARRLMRQALAGHLGPQPLRSRELFSAHRSR